MIRTMTETSIVLSCDLHPIDDDKKVSMRNLMRNRMELANRTIQLASRLSIDHVMRGVEGYADFIFPYMTDVGFVIDGKKIVDGDALCGYFFKALHNRTVMLARERLRKLFTIRDGIDLNDVDALDSVNVDITMLTAMVDDNEFFDESDMRRFQRRLIALAKKRKKIDDDDSGGGGKRMCIEN